MALQVVAAADPLAADCAAHGSFIASTSSAFDRVDFAPNAFDSGNATITPWNDSFDQGKQRVKVDNIVTVDGLGIHDDEPALVRAHAEHAVVRARGVESAIAAAVAAPSAPALADLPAAAAATISAPAAVPARAPPAHPVLREPLRVAGAAADEHLQPVPLQRRRERV